MKFDIDDLLMSNKVPSQDELLPADFRKKFNLGQVHQLGLAVPSVLEAALRLESAGLGPFFIAEDDLSFWVERGENKYFHGKMGVAMLGGYELELLEAGVGSNFYSQKFRPDGRIALHHVGFLDHCIEERTKELNDGGIETYVRGRIKLAPLTIDFAYLDARKETGLVVEFIDYRLLGRPTKPAAPLMDLAAKAMKLVGMRQIRLGRKTN